MLYGIAAVLLTALITAATAHRITTRLLAVERARRLLMEGAQYRENQALARRLTEARVVAVAEQLLAANTRTAAHKEGEPRG
ncbi:hypothetical protein ACIPW9_35950 [Streptomyces sp. NPDC090052]|uniref:hypothetical protein n=1 Tax=Streptomyces sp. NPDC090052 TaxID=3365931 RepID=UPI00381953A6